MADRPSLLNLDQVQNEIQDLQGKMSNQVSNFESQTIQQTKNVINEIGKQIQTLQNTLASQDMMGPLKTQLDETITMFKKFQEIGNQAIAAQKYEVESFTNNVSQMYEAIKKSQDAIQQFNSVPIGNVQQINEFEKSINNLKNSFEDFVSTSDIINIEQSDLDAIRQRMMSFMKDLSVEGSKVFNIAEMMTQASQDPTLKIALNNMLVPLNEAIAQIPNNVIESFAKTQNGTSNNVIQDLINSLNSFSGIVQSQVPGTGISNYDPILASENAYKRYIDNSRTVQEAETATTTRLSEHFDRMFSASHYASNVDKNIGKIGDDSVGLDIKIDRLIDALSNYSKWDLSKLSAVGIDANGIAGLKDDAGDIQKLLSNYKLKSDGTLSAINDYKQAGTSYARNSSSENLLKLIESEKKVKEEAQNAAAALDELMGFTSKYVTELDVDSTIFQKLPNEMKEVLIGMNDIFTTNLQSGNDLLKLYEAFGINMDNIGENLKRSMQDAKNSVNDMNNQITSNGNGGFFSKLFGDDSKLAGALSTVGKVVGGVAGGVGGYYNALGQVGLNPGIPTNMNGVLQYIRGGTDWYQKFGQMNYQGAIAQLAQGGSISDSELNEYKNTGKELYRMSAGQITNQDYYNIMTQLLTQVQGQYGQDNKNQSQQELQSMSKMATMIEEVYGVDSVSTINTFYKELGMGTNETNSLLGKLVETAEMANIPVSQYVKTIGELSLKFRELGVDVKTAENGMRTLTMEGMSFSMAQDLTSNMGNAISRFTNSPGQMAVYGMLSGQFSNPWEAMWKMSDRWDENGNVKSGATASIIASMGTQMDYITRMYGGNEYAQRWGMMNSLKDYYGFTDRQAVTLTNKYMSGDYESVEELFEKYFLENEEGTNNVESELQEKIVSATERLDELTKAQSTVTAAQQDLATAMENFYDILLEDMKGSIDTLTGSINDLAGKISNSGFGEGLAGAMSWLGPLGGGLFGLSSSLFGGNLLKKVFNKITGKSSKATGKAAKGAKAAANGVDDAVKAASNTADDVVRTVASGADDVIRTAGSNADDIIRTAGSSADDITRIVGNNADDVMRAVGGSSDDILKTLSGTSSKILGPLAVLLSAGFAYGDAKKEGKSTGQAATEATGSAVGAGLGGWGGAAAGALSGAAIGSAVPLVGTAIGSAIGGLIGGFGGSWGGEKIGNKAGEYIYNIFADDDKKYPSSAAAGISLSQTTAAQKLMKDMETAMKNGNIQSDKNSKDQLSVLTTIGDETGNTTRNIDSLTGKTESVEKTINKASDNLLKVLQNDGIKVKTSSLLTSSYNGGSTVGTARDGLLSDLNNYKNDKSTSSSTLSSGTSLGNGSLMGSARDNLLSDLNNYKNSKKISSSSSKTWSTSEVAGLSVNEAIHKDLSEKTNLTAGDINDWIASKTGSNSKMRGMGDAFIKASQESGLDPLYLVAHAALETGWGTSSILKNKNNWFGIGAFDSSPYESAYGFNNLEAGIIEGAKWISKNYTQDGQETLWKMINDPEGWHNYATDPQWATKIASIMITGAGGNGSYASWDGTSGADSSLSSTTNTKSYEDLIKENTFGSTIFKIGSPEWSNKASSYNINSYRDYDFGENSSYVYRDSQAMARSAYLSYYGDDIYKSAIESYDDRSSSYNQNPQFNIDININGEGGNYEAMASEIKTAISDLALKYMGSSAKIASANYYRANSQY